MSQSYHIMTISSCFLFLGLLILHAVMGEEKEYKIVVEKLDFDKKATEMVSEANMKLNAYNETATCISGFMVLLKDIPLTAWVMVLGFEQSHEDKNKYQDVPSLNESVHFCEYVETDKIIMPDLLKHSNIPNSCPMVPKNYTVTDLLMEGDGLPKRIPGSEYWQFAVYLYEYNSTSAPILARATANIHFDPTNANQNKNPSLG